MGIKQGTIGEIIETETKLVLEGKVRYDEHFLNASNLNTLLNTFLKSVSPKLGVFVIFLSQIRKHHTLALFSALRLHHTQAMMDLRQVLEAGTCAAYAIANPSVDGFADYDEQGILKASDALKNKRYKWITTYHRDGSNHIQKIKDHINSTTSHSNIIYAMKTFSFNRVAGQFDTPYFDLEDELHVKSDLWLVGNIAMGLMDLFDDINNNSQEMQFIDSFIPRLKELGQQNQKLKDELSTDPRFHY
ncbi:MAG: hypothetical protein WCV88_00385 [Patescibacteria group bacterium]|jgi:hypothetical protein